MKAGQGGLQECDVSEAVNTYGLGFSVIPGSGLELGVASWDAKYDAGLTSTQTWMQSRCE